MRGEALLEANVKSKNTDQFLSIIIFFMAILLHQSNVLFNVNISFADIFCAFILLLIIYKNQLLVPYIPILFFLIVSFIVLMTAVFYVPFKFTVSPSPTNIISDYIKLAAIFIYFIVGYNLSYSEQIERTIKWYSLFGLLIGGLGIGLTVFNIKAFSSILFYADSRYRGLMIDPNFFSVLQVTALVYFSRLKDLQMRYKGVAVFIILFSVLTSGSKTGTITLVCYLAFRIFEYVFMSKKRVHFIVSQLIFVGILIVTAPMLISFFHSFIDEIASSIPSFDRIYYLFTDFSSAISSNGSERDHAWKTAFQMILHSPFIGVGVGTYSIIAADIFQTYSIAHNTFLQMTAEWGMPLAFVFICYVLINLGKVTFSGNYNRGTNLILRDIIIILLIGSMAISLNNARGLWLFLGALIALIHKQKAEIAKK